MSGLISPSEPVIRHPVENISKDISKDEAFSVEMGNANSKSHHFDDLPETSSFRIVKLSPGKRRDPISCETEIADLHQFPKFEAISYIRDDSTAKVTVTRSAQTFREPWPISGWKTNPGIYGLMNYVLIERTPRNEAIKPASCTPFTEHP